MIRDAVSGKSRERPGNIWPIISPWSLFTSMPLRVSFNLDDADLQHFAEVALQTQAIARAQPEDAIVAAARELLDRGVQAQPADFVKERYSRLRTILDMAVDADWKLSEEDRQRVVNALACFSAPASAGPATGLLDHAIMIELVSRDLQHDLDAYRDFCRFRESQSRSVARRRAPIAPNGSVRSATRCRRACTSDVHATWTRPAARCANSSRCSGFESEDSEVGSRRSDERDNRSLASRSNMRADESASASPLCRSLLCSLRLTHSWLSYLTADDNVSLRAGRRFDFHLIVDRLAQQRTAERRVHADVTLTCVEFVRADDAIVASDRRRRLRERPTRRRKRVADSTAADPQRPSRRVAVAESGRADRSRAVAACRRCTRRSQSDRPAQRLPAPLA